MSKLKGRLLILILLSALIGCGSGVTSGDPLGTDGITVAASATSVNAGAQSVITATVVRLNNLPATDRIVYFNILVNNSGGTLRLVNDHADGQGKAVAVYTAGNQNPTRDVQDTIQVTLPNGAAAAVVITRTSDFKPFAIALASSPASLNAGKVSIITATVTRVDEQGTPFYDHVDGVEVAFSLPVNNSGATLSALTAVTDGSGRAMVIYRAGALSPTLDVQDVVRAVVGSAAQSVVITRTGAVTPPPFGITVAADPASVGAGGISIVSATLTGDNKAGVWVTFSLPVNNSGATLSSTVAVTDGTGRAVVIYQPGGSNPTASVQDAVQASAGSATGAVVITRTGTPIPTYSLTMKADPDTLTTASSSSVVTATVKTNAGTGVSGAIVTFSVNVTVPPASVSPASAVTDANGNAVTTFTGDGASLAGDTHVVSASVTVGGATLTSAVVITYP